MSGDAPRSKWRHPHDVARGDGQHDDDDEREREREMRRQAERWRAYFPKSGGARVREVGETTM